MIAPLQLHSSLWQRQFYAAGYLVVLGLLASMSWQLWYWQALLSLLVVYPWVQALLEPKRQRQLQWRQGFWYEGNAQLTASSRISRYVAVCVWQVGAQQHLGLIWRDQLTDAQWRCFARQLRLTQWQQVQPTFWKN